VRDADYRKMRVKRMALAQGTEKATAELNEDAEDGDDTDARHRSDRPDGDDLGGSHRRIATAAYKLVFTSRDVFVRQ
jgi:hypothetical protein